MASYMSLIIKALFCDISNASVSISQSLSYVLLLQEICFVQLNVILKINVLFLVSIWEEASSRMKILIYGSEGWERLEPYRKSEKQGWVRTRLPCQHLYGQ